MLIFCTNNPILFSFMTYEWVCINRNKQMIMVICSEFCKTNLVLSPFITYHRICDKRNTTDATCVWSRNCLLLIVYRNCLSFWSTWVHPTCVGFLLLFILLEYLGSPNVCGVPVAVYPSGVPGFTQRVWGSCCSILLSVYCYGAMLIVCRDAT